MDIIQSVYVHAVIQNRHLSDSGIDFYVYCLLIWEALPLSDVNALMSNHLKFNITSPAFLRNPSSQYLIYQRLILIYFFIYFNKQFIPF